MRSARQTRPAGGIRRARGRYFAAIVVRGAGTPSHVFSSACAPPSSPPQRASSEWPCHVLSAAHAAAVHTSSMFHIVASGAIRQGLSCDCNGPRHAVNVASACRCMRRAQRCGAASGTLPACECKRWTEKASPHSRSLRKTCNASSLQVAASTADRRLTRGRRTWWVVNGGESAHTLVVPSTCQHGAAALAPSSPRFHGLPRSQ